MVQLMAFAIIEQRGKLLMIQEASDRFFGKWYFPGGKIEKKERPEKGLIREAKEEAGCRIRILGICCVKYNPKPKVKKIILYYFAKATSSQIKSVADEESLKAAWFTYREALKLPLRGDALEILKQYWKTRKLKLPPSGFIIAS